ncbi:hypothetical protein HYH03_000716 [Edaphochlamys debaryana]|uniref:Methyltransferase type 11 domain-containing protein n=1 Tax=Edaphochlamys debaryana TaxID=47281 RepID=A0A835YG76_9CHLO|nr:hypothetical protein HYH03_000716 [Edaphochlamys debaryana]|eukprot:KAG2502230.1 hypothetical protein HYH03_000716 [Edaphochlamys debaryana]
MAFARSPVAAAASRSEIEKVLDDPKWPETWPFRPENFQRYDEAPDTFFYSQPRFVTHIDDSAIKALTKFYAEVLPPSGGKDTAILDICSSWVSHYPEGYTAGRVAGLGMNEEELARNPQLTEFAVKDLNVDPKLPYADNSFDVVTNVVSVDYLNKRRRLGRRGQTGGEVFKEMHRVLKPGGTAYMSFSNRCFPTKAIALWTSTGDADHVWIVGSYFHYTGGYTEPKCRDITPKPMFGGRTDPIAATARVWDSGRSAVGKMSAAAKRKTPSRPPAEEPEDTEDDIGDNRPVLYHAYFDAGDAAVISAAVANNNMITLRIDLGDSIPRAPDVPGSMYVRVPRIATVGLVRRIIVNDVLGKKVYPSFIRLTNPASGEPLEDLRPGDVREERTLASYGVQSRSILQMDIVEGDLLEALKVPRQPRGRALNTGAGPAQRQPQQQPQKQQKPRAPNPAPRKEPAAAAAPAKDPAAAKAAAPAPQRQTAAKRPAEAPASEGNAKAQRTPGQQAPAARGPGEDNGRTAAAAGGADEREAPQRRGRQLRWDHVATRALLRGIIAHARDGAPRFPWNSIISDTQFSHALQGRSGMQCKDRWVNCLKALDRGFKLRMPAGSEQELKALTEQARDLMDRYGYRCLPKEDAGDSE